MEIVGIIGLLIGILGLYLSVKFRKTTRISFYIEQLVSLLNSELKELNEIEFLYKGNSINRNLLLLKANIKNEGSRDIEKSVIKIPLKLRFKKGIKLLNAEVTQSTKNLDLDLVSEEKDLTISWGLFKSGGLSQPDLAAFRADPIRYLIYLIFHQSWICGFQQYFLHLHSAVFAYIFHL